MSDFVHTNEPVRAVRRTEPHFEFSYRVGRFYNALSTADFVLERGLMGAVIPFNQAGRELAILRTMQVPAELMAAIEADYAALVPSFEGAST